MPSTNTINNLHHLEEASNYQYNSLLSGLAI